MAASRTDQRCNANALTRGTVRTCVEARLHGSHSARREASPPSLRCGVCVYPAWRGVRLAGARSVMT